MATKILQLFRGWLHGEFSARAENEGAFHQLGQTGQIVAWNTKHLGFGPFWPENLDQIRRRPIFARVSRDVGQILPLIPRQKFWPRQDVCRVTASFAGTRCVMGRSRSGGRVMLQWPGASLFWRENPSNITKHFQFLAIFPRFYIFGAETVAKTPWNVSTE
jgi:hypothetical protein